MFVGSIHAQIESTDIDVSEKYKPNLFYFELYGNGMGLSINYERIFSQNGSINFCGRIGFSKINDPISGVGENDINVIPVEFLFFAGNNSHFEFGFGLTTFYQMSNVSNAYKFAFVAIPRIGYRFQKPNGHFVLRLGLTLPFYADNSSQSKLPFLPGLGSGVAF